MGGRRSVPSALLIGAFALAIVVATTTAVIPRFSLTSGTSPGAIGGSNRLPNGWALDPAGTQVNTQRAPTGVAVSPDGQAVYAVTSGIFEEAVESVNATTLVAAPTLVSAAYQGVASDSSGHVWVSSGPEGRVFEYTASAPGAPLVDTSLAGPAPQEPSRGIPVTGYPGNMLLDPVSHKLFVAGNISVPDSVALSASGSHCPASETYTYAGKPDTICSVVNVIDVSNPSPATSPKVTAIPVGRDAYGLAYLPSSAAGANGGTLYVSNWADQTNPARTGGSSLASATGTVSVVKVSNGMGSEKQVVRVGNGPAGIALSPDHKMLVVANSADDTLSALPLNADGSVNVNAIPSPHWVGIGPRGQHLGTQPLAVSFSPDGKYVFAALAQIDAVEVLQVHANPHSGVEQLAPISQKVTVDYSGQPVPVTSPATYIPTGWYPDAMAAGPEPSAGGAVGAAGGVAAGATSFRLYLANLKGNGAGPGYYGQLQPLVGTGTEGTLSAIDVPTAAAPNNALEKSLSSWTTSVVQGDRLAPVLDSALANPATNACLGATVPGSSNPVDSQLLCAAQRKKIDPRTLHVVFILAENKTFDAYFGDTGSSLGSNASPAFNEYPEPVTTNQHRLANQFTLSDDFWNEGAESSVVGHSWWSGGVTTPDRELTWGQDYDQGLRGGRSGGQYAPGTSANPTGFSLSGPSDPAVAQQEGLMLNPYTTLADRAGDNGLSTRVYGTDTSPVAGTPSQQTRVDQREWGEGPNSPVSTDLAFPDSDRADIFLHGTTISHAWNVAQGQVSPPSTFGKPMSLPANETSSTDPAHAYTLDGWNAIYHSCMRRAGATNASCQASSMPNFLYMEFPENHTYDVSNVLNPLDPTPASMVADNDYAIGKVISGLSKSPFWKNTVVFLSEDDNQFTGDHVDIHRTFLLTMGGLAALHGTSHTVSHQQGSFPSALKTAEVLLRLQPLTLFDSMASPLQDVVANAPNSSASDTYGVVVPPTPFLGGGTQAGALPASTTGAAP